MKGPVILIEASTALDPQRRGIGVQIRTWLEAAPFVQFPDISFLLASKTAEHTEPLTLDAPNVLVRSFTAQTDTEYIDQLHKTGAEVLFFPIADPTYLREDSPSKTIGIDYGMEDFYCRHYVAPRSTDDFISMHETALKKFDGLVTVSQTSLKDLAWFFPEYKHKLAVVYPGSAMAAVASDEVLPAALQNSRYFFVVGYELKKNILRIVEAFSSFKHKTGSDIKLAIAGKPGYGAEQLDTAIAASDFAADIVRLGYISDSQKKTILEHCQALLALSIYEGFGISALEGIETGKPVLVSDNGSLREVAGAAGYLADPFLAADIERSLTAMDQLADNPKKTYIAAQLELFDQHIQARKLLEYLTMHAK